jgi:hypothetical protein
MKQVFSNWTKLAASLLIGGALAWAIKLGVIVSTNGRIIDTGAAALFMKIGLLLIVVGSTGIGTRFGANLHVAIRIFLVLLSPVFLFALCFLVNTLTSPLVQNSSLWYAQQEAPIAVAVVVALTTGYFLNRSSKSFAVKASFQ